jgi:hypothetical protein
MTWPRSAGTVCLRWHGPRSQVGREAWSALQLASRHAGVAMVDRTSPEARLRRLRHELDSYGVRVWGKSKTVTGASISMTPPSKRPRRPRGSTLPAHRIDWPALPTGRPRMAGVRPDRPGPPLALYRRIYPTAADDAAVHAEVITGPGGRNAQVAVDMARWGRSTGSSKRGVVGRHRSQAPTWQSMTGRGDCPRSDVRHRRFRVAPRTIEPTSAGHAHVERRP